MYEKFQERAKEVGKVAAFVEVYGCNDSRAEMAIRLRNQGLSWQMVGECLHARYGVGSRPTAMRLANLEIDLELLEEARNLFDKEHKTQVLNQLYDAGFSMKELAKITGVTPRTISGYITNKRSTTTAKFGGKLYRPRVPEDRLKPPAD